MTTSQVATHNDRETGQAAALMAIMLFMVFVVFASLAIDGAMTYLARRDLQNVADSAALAACRVIAQNDTTTTPLAAAQNAVATNLGGWIEFVGSNPPGTNVGADAGLVKGIEIASPQVRVAVQRVVPTVLTQFFGRAPSPMLAQARCDARAGGGLMPIAVQRYEGEPGGSLRDYLANKAASGYPPNPPTVPYPQDSITVTLYPPNIEPRLTSFDVPIPINYAAADGTSANDPQTGPEVVLLGQPAETNNNVSSMRNLVLLDIRNVSNQDELEYYNGLPPGTQTDSAKALSQQWIQQHGYPGPYPLAGSQIAVFDGANTDQAAHALYNDARYRPGDAIAAIVYDGFVWTAPDFKITVTPNLANPDGIKSSEYPSNESTAVVYTVNIGNPPNSPPWFALQNFELTFKLTTPLPAGMQMTFNGSFVLPNTPTTVYNVPETGQNWILKIWSTEAVTQVKHLSGLTIAGRNTTTSVTRGASSNFGFGPIGRDYALRQNYGKLVVHQDTADSAILITFATNSVPSGQGCKDVPVNAQIVEMPGSWGSVFSSANGGLINIKRGENSLNFPLDVKPTASIGSYTLRFTLSNASSNCAAFPGPYTIDIPFRVEQPEGPNAKPKNFVFIQGYAVFRISRVEPNVNSPNAVYGYAISPLYPKYQDITYGLQPRLVPW